jgi:Protein of unknown function (DUF2612)
MSGAGPPFPRPIPGSNSIGRFTIGVSPIGTIPAFDFWSTVLSQYANSDGITGVIASMFQALDMTENFDNFFDAYFNLATAYGAGLDNWGRILQVSRVLQIGTGPVYWGFQQAVPGVTTFGFGAWSSGSNATQNFPLSDSAYRTLLLAKAAANISDGSIKSINKILVGLFPGRGNAYVTDGQNMTMVYTFAFPLSVVEQAIVAQSGVLPKPAGVLATVSFP